MSNIGDIFAGLVLVTAPVVEPLSLVDAETFLRVASDNGGPTDTEITTFITLARQQVETILRRALLTQTWRLSLKNWPGRDYSNVSSLTLEPDSYYKFNFIKVPLPPLQSVTSVEYMNSDGQTLSMSPANFQVLPGYTYNVLPDFEPGRIVLPFSQIWPTDILMPGAPVQITYVAGYADVATLQAKFEGFSAAIQAMKLIISFWNEERLIPVEFRRTAVPAGVNFVCEQLLEPYRIRN
jgi:uncharacterized phiE125 gp8 family phage protein